MGGRYCVFDIKTGVKKYKTKKACDFAYNAQLKAYELGAAPKVIKRIDDFSYQTEIAETEFIMKNLKEGVYYNKLFPELHKKLVDIFKNNPNKEKWGPDGVDMARHNLGMYRGKVVMIDFF
jgi:hypothetical protein